MLLENPQNASTSEPDQMAICLNSLDSEPKPECMSNKYIHDLLFADDAAITTHTQEDLHRLLGRFSKACRHFGLTISLAKTQVMGQDIKKIHSSSFTTTNKRSFMSLCTWGLPSQTICPSTVNSISKLGRLLWHCPGSHNMYGPTTNFQIIPKSMYVKPV